MPLLNIYQIAIFFPFRFWPYSFFSVAIVLILLPALHSYLHVLSRSLLLSLSLSVFYLSSSPPLFSLFLFGFIADDFIFSPHPFSDSLCFYRVPNWLKLQLESAVVAWKVGKPLLMEAVHVTPPQKDEICIKIIFTSLCHIDLYFSKAKSQIRIFPRISVMKAQGVKEFEAKWIG